MNIEKKIVELLKMKRKMVADSKARNLCDEAENCEPAQQALKLMHKRLELIELFLSLLNSDQRFVIERHFIDGMAWPTLTNEYEKCWPEAPKAERTLLRKQVEAIEIMREFALTHMQIFQSLLDFETE